MRITIDDLKNRNIAVWGLGLNAVKCSYFLTTNGIEIECYFSNSPKVNKFCGKSVYEFDDKNKEDLFIIVATNVATYRIISKQLEGFGVVEFSDYIFYEWIGRKLVLLNGNCHMTIIQEYLMSLSLFNDLYSIYPAPLVCDNEEGISKTLCKQIDVFIHEDIRSNNEFGYKVSDEWIRSNVKNNIIDITIPHLFGLGKCLFPQHINAKNNLKINNGLDSNGMFPYGDSIIEGLLEEGRSEEYIIDYCKSNNAIEEKIILDNYTEFMNKIRVREESWDIKIYDFILSNIKDNQLFYDKGHPTNFVLHYISEKIAEILGVMKDDELICNNTLDTHEEPVYPVVKKVLGLKWEKKYIRNSKDAKKMKDKMDFEEYIKEYIYWKKISEA